MTLCQPFIKSLWSVLFCYSSLWSVLFCYSSFLCNVFSMFFSQAQKHRWNVLLANVGVMVKRKAETRWSAHYNSVKPVFKCFNKIVYTIEKLSDSSETLETRGPAQTLLTFMWEISFLLFLCLWNSILEEVNPTQKYFQIVETGSEMCLIRMRSLNAFMNDNR